MVRPQDGLFAQQHRVYSAVTGKGRIVGIKRLRIGLSRHLVDAVGNDTGALQNLAGSIGAPGGRRPIVATALLGDACAGVAADGDAGSAAS